MLSTIKITSALLACASTIAHAAVTRRDHCDPIVISIDKTISYGGSEPRNDPTSPALIVSNALAENTEGGPAVSTSKCVYFYKPDSSALADELDCVGTAEECAADKYDGQHLYTGSVWPYIMTEPDCAPTFDATVAEDSPLRAPGFVQVENNGVVTIGGLPLYQYPTDDADNCLCNFGPWGSLGPDGASPQFDVTQRS